MKVNKQKLKLYKWTKGVNTNYRIKGIQYSLLKVKKDHNQMDEIKTVC